MAHSARIIKPSKVNIGMDVHVNEGVYIVGPVFVGDNVTLSYNSIILGVGYDTNLFRYGDRTHVDNPTYIGESTWVCAGAIICPGVRITGKHIIIAAGSVVVDDIFEDDVVVAGCPARVVKKQVQTSYEKSSIN